MDLLHNYLSSKKVKQVLTTKPEEEGFSLIELVVVVAVLAIVAAFAIPSFNAIACSSSTAAAKNTLVTLLKECAVKRANSEQPFSFDVPNIQWYVITPRVGNNCNGMMHSGSNNWIVATIVPEGVGASCQQPLVIKANLLTGEKACLSQGNTPITFCNQGRW